MLTKIYSDLRQTAELVGARLLQIGQVTFANIWHVALLHLYKYAALQHL